MNKKNILAIKDLIEDVEKVLTDNLIKSDVSGNKIPDKILTELRHTIDVMWDEWFKYYNENKNPNTKVGKIDGGK